VYQNDPGRRYCDDPGGKNLVVMHTAMQQLALVSEAKLSDILPGRCGSAISLRIHIFRIPASAP